MDIETESISEGLKRFNTIGGYVVPVRLNKRMKNIILALIKEDKSKSFDMSDTRLDKFLTAMLWLENKLTGNKNINIKFNREIAYELFCFVSDKKYHHLSSEKHFESAMNWVTKQWNSKYAQSRLIY